MAQTAATATTDFSGFLTAAESAPIFNDAARQSAFQQLFRRVSLGINGQKIPVVTNKPTANWVGEGGQKPTTEGGLGLLTIEPQKLAAISVMSAEVIRANPGNYTGQLRQGLAEAFATAFDLAVGYNVGGDGTGSGPFDNHLAETSKAVEVGSTTQANGGIHGDLVAAMSLLIADGKKLTGFGLDDSFEPLLWGAVDANGRPLYTELPTDDVSQGIARPGRLLNRPSFMGDGVGASYDPDAGGAALARPVVGFAGDFTKGAWGAVGGISYRVSTEATVTINGTLTSLFEHNLVAVLAEAEYGFVVADTEAFVRLDNAA
ncbi:MAG TPA: phage major capsid protein [Nocardioidaceae bacterium]|nr:phage major capsid protein [Nocardioidaceae bacterium]